MDDALRARDMNKTKKLYEAALCKPLRLRLGPSKVQVALDSITYSEDLYAGKTASSDSFFDYTVKALCVLPQKPAVTELTSRQVQEQATRLGITFHRNSPNDRITRALQNVAPLVSFQGVKVAFTASEDASFALNDQTNIASLGHTTSKHHGRGTDATVGDIVEVLGALRFGLMFKDTGKDSHLTKEFLFGGRNTPPHPNVSLFHVHHRTNVMFCLHSHRIVCPQIASIRIHCCYSYASVVSHLPCGLCADDLHALGLL
jgi:hypothetical protein